MTLTYTYSKTTYTLSENQYEDFLNDNNLKNNTSDKQIVLKHFMYFNLLHKIYEINTLLPLYTSYNTPYIPQTPPRVFTELFTELSLIWKLTLQEMYQVHAYYDPSKSRPDEKTYLIDPYEFKYDSSFHASHAAAKEHMLKNAYVFKDEIWLKQDNILHPYSLRLGCTSLYPHMQPNLIHNKELRKEIDISGDILDILSDYSNDIPELIISSRI